MKRKVSSLIPIIIILAVAYFFFFDQKAEPTLTFVSDTDSLVVRYLDVGQADATVFHLNDADEEYVILYDVGDWRGEEVVDYLHDHQIDSIDLIIISHPHADHIGQLKPILEQFTVEEVWTNGAETDTDLFLTTMETLLANDSIAYNEPNIGDTYEVGPLHIEVLHPDPAELTGDLNNDSLSIMATFGEKKFLFTGDAGVKTEREIMAHFSHLEADILQLGHHGSNTSSDEAFIDAVNPAYAIYSAGLDNKYGHPSPEVVELFKQKEIPLYGTIEDGTITVTTDGKKLDLVTEKNGDKLVKSKQDKDAEIAKKKEKAEVKTISCIDVNKATLDELRLIKHINEERAEEIIELRPLTSLDQLTNVNGIGPKRLEDIIEEDKACIQ